MAEPLGKLEPPLGRVGVCQMLSPEGFADAGDFVDVDGDVTSLPIVALAHNKYIIVYNLNA